MARERSDKSKNKPLDKSVDKKKKIKAGQPEEGTSTTAEPIGENPPQHRSLQPAAKPKQRQEGQRILEPSPDSRESEKFSEDTQSITAPNGSQDIVDDSATHRRIAERAYILFQESGCEHGNDWAHWFEAERQIKEIRV